jgi:hypothetical protein
MVCLKKPKLEYYKRKKRNRKGLCEKRLEKKGHSSLNYCMVRRHP